MFKVFKKEKRFEIRRSKEKRCESRIILSSIRRNK